MEEQRMTSKTGQALIKDMFFYRRLLGLEPWDITLKFVDMEKFSNKTKGEGQLGEAVVNEHCFMARIEILRLDDPEWNHERNDPEETLVHELLHVVFYYLVVYRDDLLALMQEEQCINATAKALVKLRHKPKEIKYEQR